MGRRERRTQIGGQFSARLIEMLESPAYRALSQSGHRILSRIEIEMAHHGGKDNGSLPVTYDDFQRYGVDRHSINAAIREVVALGFIRIAKEGRAGNAEFRRPTIFRLTYRHSRDGDPTNDWKKIETKEQANEVVWMARNKNRIPVGGFTNASGDTPHRNHSGKPPTTTHGGKPPTTLDI
ncbi:MAG: hypothetical protein GEU95_10570 [Rhizobiales bacterium]|nr:hypothetical protein [Hyphomicrobiales bacterium]